MRIGIFGGSFSPIHIGHLGMAREILTRHLVDRLWFVVSPQNPFKQNAGDSLWDDDTRLRLTRTAVEDVPGLEVSDIEFHMPRPSYMYDTLERLSHENPDDTFVLIIGTDNWERFGRWYKSKEIKEKYEIIVLPREEEKTSPIPSNWRGDYKGKLIRHIPSTLLDVTPPWEETGEVFPLIDISSTWIRQQLAENPEYQGEGLPARVWREIKSSSELLLVKSEK